jgi:hypothetical protein
MEMEMEMEGWRQSVQSVTPFLTPGVMFMQLMQGPMQSLNFASSLSGNERVDVDASHAHTLLSFPWDPQHGYGSAGCRGVHRVVASSEEPPQSQGRGLIPHPLPSLYSTPHMSTLGSSIFSTAIIRAFVLVLHFCPYSPSPALLNANVVFLFLSIS